jgi:ATP-dependent protease ClpP protease subunit
MDIVELLKAKDTSNKVSFTDRPIGHSHEFYLSGEIESAEEYIEWFDKIRHAGESDFIKIYINSPGGDLFTAIQFLRVLSETEATVICSVEGACMSAATMIFLCASQYEVTPHSMFMFHNYSGGTIGKGGEMIDQLQHERTWSANLLREVYKDFLTDGNEVMKRLNAKIELIQSRMNPQPTAPANKGTKTPAKKAPAKK